MPCSLGKGLKSAYFRIKLNYMKQLFTFWGKYVDVPIESRLFIKNNSNILVFKKDELYVGEEEYKPFWNFVLEGLIGGHTHDEDAQKTLHWIAEVNGYFTGSLHLHSDTPCQQAIQFLHCGRIVQIPLEKMRYAQENDWAINELIQVLKQHKMNQQELLIKVLSQKNTTLRYFTFMDEMSMLANQLTAEEIMVYIQIKRTSYKIARKKYLRRKL